MPEIKAVILVEEGVQDQEFFGPLYIAQYAGIDIDVAVPDLTVSYKGKYGIPIKGRSRIGWIAPDDYDLVIVPGGYQCPEKLRQVPEALQFIKEMNDRKKVCAFICHGPWVAISAGIAKGRKMTCYKGMKDDLINAGAEYINADVVIDDNIISSPHYDQIPEFMREVVSELRKRSCQKTLGT